MVKNEDIRLSNELPYIDILEWEGLHKNYEIGKRYSFDSRSLPHGSKTMEVFRNKDYQINGKLFGDLVNREEFVPLEFNLHQPKYRKNYTMFYILDVIANYEMNCLVTNLIYRGSKDGEKFEAMFDIDFVRRDFHNTSKIAWLTEWFLNGGNIFYDTTIHSELLKSYERRMNEPQYPTLGHSHRFHQDSLSNLTQTFGIKSYDDKGYIFVEFEDKNGADKCFTIQSVPDNYGPFWSKNIAIEYKSEWWIPSFEERIKINEIVSFLLGRQLISVGYTKYDAKGRPIEDYVNTPRISDGIHLKEICKDKYISSPVNTIKGNNNKNNLRIYLNQLIPEYFALRDELKLHEVLEKYWLAQSIPIEAEINIMASCLESLVNSWYKSKKSKSKRIYLPEVEFKEIMNIYLDNIGNDLKVYFDSKEDSDFSPRILRRVLNSFQMSYNESIDFFFKEIKLPIGKIEKKTIKYRNKPVHGGITEQDYDELPKMTNSYRTLVNRTILKILGYNQEYIDYYHALDQVPINEYVRHINEPIGD